MLSSRHVDAVRRVFPDAELSVDFYPNQMQYIYSLVAGGQRVSRAVHDRALTRHAYYSEETDRIIEALVFSLVRDKMYS